MGVTLHVLLPADHEDRTGSEWNHPLGHTSHEELRETRAPVSAHHDQIRALRSGGSRDLLVGRAPIHLEALHPQFGLLCLGDERGKLFQKVWDMVYDDYYTIPIAYPAQIAGISDRIEWKPRIDSLFLLNEVAWTK